MTIIVRFVALVVLSLVTGCGGCTGCKTRLRCCLGGELPDCPKPGCVRIEAFQHANSDELKQRNLCLAGLSVKCEVGSWTRHSRLFRTVELRDGTKINQYVVLELASPVDPYSTRVTQAEVDAVVEQQIAWLHTAFLGSPGLLGQQRPVEIRCAPPPPCECPSAEHKPGAGKPQRKTDRRQSQPETPEEEVREL